MTADALVEVLRLVELALFSVLAVRSLQCWRGDRGEAAGWLAASFAVLAGVTLAGIFLPEHPTGPAGVWEMKAVVGVLLLFPYCLHRFTAAFRSGSHQSDRLFFLLTAFVIGWTLVLPGGPIAPDPAPVSFQAYVFAVLGEWTLVSFLAAGWLWRAGRGQPAVARLRMRTLSSASVMVNAAVLTLGLAPPTGPPAAHLVVQLLGLVSAWLFFVGFAPPAALKAMWRQSALESSRRADAQLINASSPEAVAEIIVPQAVALLGGRSAFMSGAGGRLLAATGISGEEAQALAAQVLETTSAGWAVVRQVRPGLLALAVRGGWLAVGASPVTPFFGQEELGLLQGLGHSAGLALERAELYERDRASREALQERESQLAQAQRLARLGSWEWRLDSGEVVWSEEMYRIYELDPGDLDAAYRWFHSHVPPDEARVMEAAVRRSVASGAPFSVDHRVVTADGRVKWLHTRGRAVVDDHGRPVLLQGTAQEITAQKQAEDELKARADQQAAVARLGQQALGGLDLAGLLQETTALVAQVLGTERTLVLELLPEGRSLMVRAGVGWQDGVVGRATVPAGHDSLAGHALAAELLITDDLEAEARFRVPDLFVEHGATSQATVVIPGHGAPFGLLIAATTELRCFGFTDVDFLKSMANVLAAAIERHRSEAELAHQALHDPLTGLPNRALLTDRLAQASARARRRPLSLALLFLDLDRFKVVNDGLGHGAGDELLKAVAGRLVALVRPSDTVARFGGDEFVVLCEDLAGESEAVALARRIAESVSRPLPILGREVTITVSTGIVLTDADQIAPEALLRDADTAMYQAKERGRARYEVFDRPARKRVMDRLETELALRRALERKELRLAYQPEISVSDGRLVGLEALLRWHHPDWGLQLPDTFLSLAEETGLLVPMGTWALEEACRQGRVCRDAHPQLSDLTVWVNLSARQLMQPDLLAVVAHVLAETGTEPGQLGLEITESALMEDVEALGETLRALKRQGVLLAIDDFGTGFSSLSYLRRFPVDILKVDRSFVAGMTGDDEDAAIVAAVLGLAHTLGMQVVAEGVETSEQLAALHALGCDAAQGYFFSKGLEAGALEEFLAGEVARRLAPATSAGRLRVVSGS